MYKAPDRKVNLQHPKAGAGPLPPTFRSPIGLDADLARSHQVPSPPALCILLSAFQVLPPPPSEMPGLAPAATSTSDNLRLCTKDVYRARARAPDLALTCSLICSALLSSLAASSALRSDTSLSTSLESFCTPPAIRSVLTAAVYLPGPRWSLARGHQPYPTARRLLLCSAVLDADVHDLLIHVDSILPPLVPPPSKRQLSSLALWIPSGLRDRLRVGLAALLSLS
ncbi:hypothetical protein CCMA1212_010676 [Trichoderma ghanense]|uniref:Uncharacterized protein n=1 Tax=Trichoderma ghanense TaxID=65468 RepID=A0ABY2GPH2_9HYPO